MVAIVIRAITALAHAQTAFETRTRIDQDCDTVPLASDMQVLVVRLSEYVVRR
jgi:hypothetical protein